MILSYKLLKSAFSYKPLVSSDTPENLRFHTMSICFCQILWLCCQPSMAHDMGETVSQTFLYGYMLSVAVAHPEKMVLNQLVHWVHCHSYFSTESSFGVKHLLILDYVITGPCKLVGNGLYCNYFIRPGHLPLIILPDIWIPPYRKVSRLYICP